MRLNAAPHAGHYPRRSRTHLPPPCRKALSARKTGASLFGGMPAGYSFRSLRIHNILVYSICKAGRFVKAGPYPAPGAAHAHRFPSAGLSPSRPLPSRFSGRCTSGLPDTPVPSDMRLRSCWLQFFIKKARKVMPSCVTLSIILHVPSCVPSAALYCASSKIQLSSIFHGNGHSDRHNRQNPKPPAHDHILFPSRSVHRKSLCQNVKYPNQGLLIWVFCSFTCGRAAGSWQRCRQSPQNRRPSTAYPASTRQRARPRPARPPKSCCLAPGRCAGRRPGIG